MERERIVAIGLLTNRDVRLLGPTFHRIWPIEEAPAFADLLRAIDSADHKLQRNGEVATAAGDSAR